MNEETTFWRIPFRVKRSLRETLAFFDNTLTTRCHFIPDQWPSPGAASAHAASLSDADDEVQRGTKRSVTLYIEIFIQLLASGRFMRGRGFPPGFRPRLPPPESEDTIFKKYDTTPRWKLVPPISITYLEGLNLTHQKTLDGDKPAFNFQTNNSEIFKKNSTSLSTAGQTY